MGALGDFAEWFKSRKVGIKKWYSDDVGRWAFRVEVDGTDFICAARSSSASNGTTSIMKRVAGHAQTRDALIAIRLRDDIFVFDPVAVLADGTPDEVVDPDRRDRGETWVEVPLSLACSFRDWYDGTDAPSTYADVETH